jgi:hypothetical protein
MQNLLDAFRTFVQRELERGLMRGTAELFFHPLSSLDDGKTKGIDIAASLN